MQADKLSDADFLTAFENCALDKQAFTHAGHVRLGWLCLQQEKSLPRAAQRCATAIQRFAEHHGASMKFHRTLTLAFMHVLHARFSAQETFADFCRRNPELFDNARTLIAVHYSDAVLMEQKARTDFVPPDRAPLP